jgi:DNA polymerase III delta prime subunit
MAFDANMAQGFPIPWDAVEIPHAPAGEHADGYLIAALGYLKDFTRLRLAIHFQKERPLIGILEPPEPTDQSSFAKFVRHCELTNVELMVLLTALAPHVVSGFFDTIIQEFLPQGGEFPEFGGIRGNNHRGTLPTGETALFLLAGSDSGARLAVQPVFDDDRILFKQKILSLETVRTGEPALSGRLILDQEFVEVFTTGKVALPHLSTSFPAEHISTQMEWNDLVLPESVWEQIGELERWIRHHSTLMSDWGMDRRLKPGYRVLFYGPPGTGKTLTATLLGKYTGRDVFRIDLSVVISKYIGETEKNLAALFDKAEHKNWILFFDEADAIFGKRTGVRDAHDKYANQEVSYLLQRIEMHPGLTILASNFKNNMDEAFVRRFNSIIYFPIPGTEERYRLFEKGFPTAVTLAADVNLHVIASRYELTGSHIMNAVQYICLTALDRGEYSISNDDIVRAVRRELEKEGK